MTANLLSRLQGLTAPDREVDALIWLEFTPGATRKQWSYIHTATGRECHMDETRDATGRLIIVPELTSSLDAAVALCERVLPGWKKHMWDAGVFGSILPTAAVLEPDFVRKSIKGEPYIKVDGEGPTPAIALLIAILTALETCDASN